MAGNRQGGLKAYQTMKERLKAQGMSIEQHFREIGRKGGMAETITPKGFAADRDRASRAGQKGGKVSKRKKS